MPRPDLMALSPDDLAVLTNRGTVKRAQRELESGEIRGELDEAADGEVSARWSDGVECRLPHGKVIGEGRCTCPATELCRHLIRTVLAYQKRVVAVPPAGVESPAPAEPSGPWDPGQIGDDALAVAFKPAALTRALGEFQQGLLAELVRGAKPSAVPRAAAYGPVPGAGRHPLYPLRLCRAGTLPACPARRLGVPDARALRDRGLRLDPASGAAGPHIVARRSGSDAPGVGRAWYIRRPACLGRPADPAGGALPRRRPGLAG